MRTLLLLAVLLLSVGTAWAVDLSVTVNWVEPVLANDPALPATQLKQTSIQYALWACLDMPPEGVRVESRNTPRNCGYQAGTIVPASGPAGGATMTTAFTILNAPAGLEKLELRLISLEKNGGIALRDGWWPDVQYVELTVPPSGEMLWQPTYLQVK